MIREIGVAAVPGSSFFREDVNRYIRIHFAKVRYHASRLLTAGAGNTSQHAARH